MKNFLIFLFLPIYISSQTVAGGNAYSQDSLKKVFAKQTKPESRISLVNVLLREMYNNEDDEKDSIKKYYRVFRSIYFENPSMEPKLRAHYFYNTSRYYKVLQEKDSAIFYSRNAYDLFARENDIKSLIECYDVITAVYTDYGQYDSTIKYGLKNIALCRQINDKKSEAWETLFLAMAYGNKGNRNLALDHFNECLRLCEGKAFYTVKFQTYVALSYFYNTINPKNSKKYLHEADKLIPKVNTFFEWKLYSAWGNAYTFNGDNDSALYFFKKAISRMDSSNNLVGYGSAIGNIADLLIDNGDYKTGIAEHERSLKFFERSHDTLDIAIALGSMADAYLKMSDFKKAISLYSTALQLSYKLRSAEQLSYNYSGISTCYEKIGDYKNAYMNFRFYKQWNDSLNNVDLAKKLTEKEMNFTFDMKQKEQFLLQKSKDQITEEQIKRQRVIIWSSIVGAVALLIFLIITMRNNLIRKRINAQLAQSHKEIASQKSIIETKNREITDSILYASRLQQGILPDLDDVKKLLPGSFIFYKPRDIVSGDFYWIRELKGSNQIGYNNPVAIVVADCTGHGVPGAFMSFIGSTILNQTLDNSKVETPADALNYLNAQLPLTLQSKVKTGQINDGMEAGICVIDIVNNKLFYAGANLNLVHIRKNTVSELRGDKHSIGIGAEQQKKFTNQELKIEPGDCIYLFSDGYPDQFGGPKGKKFKYKNLIELLVSVSALPADEQLKKISQNFNDWKKEIEQLDDVLVFGLKV